MDNGNDDVLEEAVMPLNKSLEEIHDLLYRLKYPPTKGAYQVKLTDVENAIQALIQSELKKQRENIRKQLPEKLPKDSNEFSDAFIRGYNRGVDQITKILDSLERSE